MARPNPPGVSSTPFLFQILRNLSRRKREIGAKASADGARRMKELRGAGLGGALGASPSRIREAADRAEEHSRAAAVALHASRGAFLFRKPLAEEMEIMTCYSLVTNKRKAAWPAADKFLVRKKDGKRAAFHAGFLRRLAIGAGLDKMATSFALNQPLINSLCGIIWNRPSVADLKEAL